MMIDNYYVDLARSVMAEAEGKLVSAQKYLRDAGLSDEIAVTQRTINSIRRQNDYLSLLPPNKSLNPTVEAGSASDEAKSDTLTGAAAG